MGKRIDVPPLLCQRPAINTNMTDLMNRRSFLGNAIAGLAASGFLTQMRGWAQAATDANGLNMPIGFQSYVFREEISRKPRETMVQLASYGYRAMEWCSPKGYQGPFTPLVKYSGKELKKITNDSGLETSSCHFTWNEIMDDNSLAERIESQSFCSPRVPASSGLTVLPSHG